MCLNWIFNWKLVPCIDVMFVARESYFHSYQKSRLKNKIIIKLYTHFTSKCLVK